MTRHGMARCVHRCCFQDTTVSECFERVKRLFEETDAPIFKFNAFGRIFHSSKTSPPLLDLVRKCAAGALNVNTRFSLNWAMEDIEYRKQIAGLTTLLNFQLLQIDAQPESEIWLKEACSWGIWRSTLDCTLLFFTGQEGL